MSKMGRPKKSFTQEDWRVLLEITKLHATKKEMEGALDCDEEVLDREIKEKYGMTFPVFFENYSAKGKLSLRRMMWEEALKTKNWKAMQFLSKNVLNMKETVEHDHKGIPAPIPSSPEEKERLIKVASNVGRVKAVRS